MHEPRRWVVCAEFLFQHVFSLHDSLLAQQMYLQSGMKHVPNNNAAGDNTAVAVIKILPVPLNRLFEKRQTCSQAASMVCRAADASEMMSWYCCRKMSAATLALKVGMLAMIAKYCSDSARSARLLPGCFNQAVRSLASASLGAICSSNSSQCLMSGEVRQQHEPRVAEYKPSPVPVTRRYAICTPYAEAWNTAGIWLHFE